MNFRKAHRTTAKLELCRDVLSEKILKTCRALHSPFLNASTQRTIARLKKLLLALPSDAKLGALMSNTFLNPAGRGRSRRYLAKCGRAYAGCWECGAYAGVIGDQLRLCMKPDSPPSEFNCRSDYDPYLCNFLSASRKVDIKQAACTMSLIVNRVSSKVVDGTEEANEADDNLIEAVSKMQAMFTQVEEMSEVAETRLEEIAARGAQLAEKDMLIAELKGQLAENKMRLVEEEEKVADLKTQLSEQASKSALLLAERDCKLVEKDRTIAAVQGMHKDAERVVGTLRYDLRSRAVPSPAPSLITPVGWAMGVVLAVTVLANNTSI